MFMDLAPWIGFLVLVFGLLALDLGVFHKDAHVIERKEALTWSAIWISIALVFNVGVVVFMGRQAGIEWFTGYLVEKSLAVDNIFVILLIFSTFAVPPIYQHRVLFWGIVGAIVMRAILILFAGFLLDTFHFIIYVFGGFLILTGIRFLREKDDHGKDLTQNKLVVWAKKRYPMTEGYEGQRFFVKRGAVRYMTPLFLVLILVEFTDLVFAVDSIPAIYAVTDDPFIVFTSNIFAILGLRSLYFVLAGYLAGLKYLKPGLAAVLIFVGGKMVLVDTYKIPSLVSLAVIISILTIATVASLRAARAAGPIPARSDTDGAPDETAPQREIPLS